MLPSDRTEIEKVKDKSDPAVIKDLITYHSDILEKLSQTPEVISL